MAYVKASSSPPIVYGFLVAIDMNDKYLRTSPEQLRMRLAEGPQFMEGVGHVNVDYIGEIEIEEEQK